ncbi:MAG: membrane protein insertase YidC [Pontiellaceae bacterium]
MNKKDFTIVILLALLIPAWMFIDRTYIAPRYATPLPPLSIETTSADETPLGTNSTTPAISAAMVPLAIEMNAKDANPVLEKTVVLANEQLEIVLSSQGGGIIQATLFEYADENSDESESVQFNYNHQPALSYLGISGLEKTDAFQLDQVSKNKVTLTKELPSGIYFQRTLTLQENYKIEFTDRFINQSNQAILLPARRIHTGYISNPIGTDGMQGLHILGVDSYTPSGGVNYWGRKLNKLFKKNGNPAALDTVPEDMRLEIVDWVSAKNKFFTHILRPHEPIATMAVLADRDLSEKGILPTSVAATLNFSSTAIEQNHTIQLPYTLYIGPKQYDLLKKAGNSMEKVMEFETIGFWSFTNVLMEPSRKALLYSMNLFNQYLPGGYGIAIIILTLLIRILFWPLTHKSTESMKRMQEIQPELKALQEKYKKDPQRMQQETMKLYKERRVNPMGGCLPMFIQIPVFFALFTVLRNAIELRFSSFLWIKDLSTAENLFAGSIPIVGALNILPIIMSLSMIWQQKLSSPGTAMTPEQQQQQRIMMFMMPIMMLFFFYTMPSGLVLYWTVSNLLMIGQIGMRNIRQKKA